MSKKEIVTIICFFLSFVLLYFFGNKYQDEKKDIIDENKLTTVAKVFTIDSRRSFTSAKFYFYFNDVRYESGKHIDNSGEMYINKYYKIEIATIKPEYSRILLDQEVTDSAEIAKAGFTLGEPKKSLIIVPHSTEINQQR